LAIGDVCKGGDTCLQVTAGNASNAQFVIGCRLGYHGAPTSDSPG
jgi:hypothetical protein